MMDATFPHQSTLFMFPSSSEQWSLCFDEWGNKRRSLLLATRDIQDETVRRAQSLLTTVLGREMILEYTKVRRQLLLRT